jgi:hypothetical protein
MVGQVRHAEAILGVGGLCRGAQCRQEPRPVPRGALLCQVCERGLATDLARLPILYGECERLLEGADRRPLGARTSGGPLPGISFNSAAADIREAIRAVLGSWSGLVAAERRITPPPRAVVHLVRFLSRHISWLSRHPAAVEITREISELVVKARQVAHPDPLRRVRVGTCVEAGCTGELTALVRSEARHLPGDIRCSSDTAHRWPADEWTRLSRLMARNPSAGDGETRWLGPTEVARLWRIPTGSVYRLAGQHHWRRRNQSGRVYYDADDVEQTFAERAGR